MTTKANPLYLDLDELESTKSEISIKHKGEEHFMRTLTVESFVKYQKQLSRQEKMMGEGQATEDNIQSAVEIMSESISDFFPTLPVKELPVDKLFVIFNWFSQLSEEINGDAPLEEAPGAEDGEGNPQGETS